MPICEKACSTAKAAIRISENVKGTKDVVSEIARGECDLQVIRVCPTDAGFGCVRRDREYIVHVDRRRARFLRNVQDVYNEISAALAEKQLPQSEAWFAEDETTVLAELKIRARKKPKPPTLDPSSVDWTGYLTQGEQTSIATYKAGWALRQLGDPQADPDCVFSLRQNAAVWWTASHKDGSLPTFLEGGGKLWSPNRQRWLSTVQGYAIHGFPATEQLAEILNVEMLDVHALQKPVEMLGDGMHVANAGLVLLAAMACIEIHALIPEPVPHDLAWLRGHQNGRQPFSSPSAAPHHCAICLPPPCFGGGGRRGEGGHRGAPPPPSGL